jgi:circadian clock protein KaiB
LTPARSKAASVVTKGDVTVAKKQHEENSLADFEQAAKEAEATAGDRQYVLRLYVAGMSPRSSSSIKAITELCEEHLNGHYELEIIDIYQSPALAKDEQIIAAPTLIKKLPEPLRRFIGNLADRERILVGLDVRPKKK